MNKHKVLYISYDGMTDPLGQSQVLSYLKVLSGYGFSFHILSYEKKDRFHQHRSFVEDFIKGHDITWHPLPYTNTPPVLSTVNNIRKGKRKIKELCRIYHFSIVHCRGYIPSIMGEWLKKRAGIKFIFDMRGWWADEKREAGEWNSWLYQPIYKYFRKRETGFFRNCDLAISLTHEGQRHIIAHQLKAKQDIAVIPTCVNFDVFPPFNTTIRNEARQSLQLPENVLVMVYSGSLGGSYRTDIVLKFFRYLLARRPDSFFLFITHSSPEIIEKEIIQSGISRDRFRQVSAAYSGVHRYLMAGDMGVVMYNTGFSIIGRSPTKLGEYWACGLRVLSARGIGDLDHLEKMYPNGISLADDMQHEEALDGAVEKSLVVTISKDELRSFATDYFDLDKGCLKYLEGYRGLTGTE